MSINTTSNSSQITITATGEDLTFDKIATQIDGLNDSNNFTNNETLLLTKKLVLNGNQKLHLGANTRFQFKGTNRFLSIGSGFTLIESGYIIEGERIAPVKLSHHGNITTSVQKILDNSTEVHLNLVISQDTTSDYPRMYIKNTNTNSTMKLIVSSVYNGTKTEPHIYFRGSFAGENECMFENSSYEPFDSKWINIVRANCIDRFKTLPNGASYPSSGYNYGGKRGQFGYTSSNTYFNGLVSDIGLGTDAYVFHPGGTHNLFFRYDFKFKLLGASTQGATLAFKTANEGVFKEVPLTGNEFEIKNVLLYKGNNNGGTGTYRPIHNELINRKIGEILIRKAGIVSKVINYEKKDGISSFDIRELIISDNNFSNTPSNITEISNADELYDYFQHIKADNLDIEEDLITANGYNLVIKNGYKLLIDNSINNPIVVDGTNIKIKASSNGIDKTSKFVGLDGDIDDSLIGNTELSFQASDGKVKVRFRGLNPKNFAYDANAKNCIIIRKKDEDALVKNDVSKSNVVEYENASTAFATGDAVLIEDNSYEYKIYTNDETIVKNVNGVITCIVTAVTNTTLTLNSSITVQGGTSIYKWTKYDIEATSVNELEVRLPANTDYVCRVRCLGYKWRELTINSRTGSTYNISLTSIQNKNFSDIMSISADTIMQECLGSFNLSTQKVTMVNTKGRDISIDMDNLMYFLLKIHQNSAVVLSTDYEMVPNGAKDGVIIDERNRVLATLDASSTGNILLQATILEKFSNIPPSNRFLTETKDYRIDFYKSVISVTTNIPSEVSEPISKITMIDNNVSTNGFLIDAINTKVGEINTKVEKIDNDNIDIAYTYTTTQDTNPGYEINFVRQNNLQSYKDNKIAIYFNNEIITTFITAQSNNTLTLNRPVPPLPTGTKIMILSSSVKETRDILEAVKNSSLFIPSSTEISS